MKHAHLFIALTLCTLVATSCNNNKKHQKEVVKAAKTVLAEETLSLLDNMAQQFIDQSNKFVFQQIKKEHFTQEELLAKPNYLLDPKEVETKITKSQKTNALAVYYVERYYRELYDMPLEETDKAIAKLSADLNHPLAQKTDTMSVVQHIEHVYNHYKNRGELSLFWQFQYTFSIEILYLVSQNPEPFFRTVSEEQYQGCYNRMGICLQALSTLANYDEELNHILKYHLSMSAVKTDDNLDSEKAKQLYYSKETAKDNIVKRKDILAARRARLLQ